MEVRCPIHGLIQYSDLEERVINSRVVQRLRNIHQLAMAYLVYPGALHTRFDHSLGVMHVAGRMARCLGLRGEQAENIRLAALLHDVGHGPFSHVSEVALAMLSGDYVKRKGLDTEKLHECITVDIINHDEELGQILGSRREDVVRLIDTVNHGDRTAAGAIVSGPLDADKFDYLLRDSYFCGVQYGVYDLDRLMDGIVRIDESEGRSSVGIKRESVWALEQHLMARYHMTTQVYRHRVRRSTDILLARAILLAAEMRLGDIDDLYTYKGSRKRFTSRWLAYTDSKLIDIIAGRAARSRAGRLMSLLKSRRLPCHVFTARLSEFPTLYRGKLTRSEEQEEVARGVANICSLDRDLVVVDLVQTEPPRPSSAEPEIDPEEILVYDAPSQPMRFHEVSDIFPANPLTRKDPELTIYLPLQGTTSAERCKEREKLRPLVAEAIRERTKEGQNGD